ncbi:hypothetical protein GCM10008932_02000 [Alkalibacterium iburiense]|uniref:Prepilin-type N-terminal cleavage/methylation domain-containing protein n=1 Tax=Alkalibacterium iburiense TaxID=290589 RepID=A0ABN0X1K6_9LACT
MLNNIKESEGFTLIETALVLSIVSIILSLPIVHFKALQVEAETQLFFETLGSSLTLAQSYAILNQDWPLIEFKPDTREVSFRAGKRTDNHPINHRISFPDSISMPGGTREFRFSSSTGNQSNISPIPFDTAKGRVNVRFKFGKGRFTVEYD